MNGGWFDAALRKTPGRLTMNGGVGRGISADSGPGVVDSTGWLWWAQNTGCCWVPAGDAGMTGVVRTARRRLWAVRFGKLRTGSP